MRNREPHDLEGASILLAGATGVLGAEIGRQLVKAGAHLTLFARDEAKLAQLGLPGPRVVGDIADVDACTECVWEAVTRFGRIDGVVNATGVVAFGRDACAVLTDPALLCDASAAIMSSFHCGMGALASGFLRLALNMVRRRCTTRRKIVPRDLKPRGELARPT